MREYVKGRWIGFLKENEAVRYWKGRPVIPSSWEEFLSAWKEFRSKSVQASAGKYAGSLSEAIGSDSLITYSCLELGSCSAVVSKVTEELSRLGASPWLIYNGEEVTIVISWKCYDYAKLKGVTPSYISRKVIEGSGLSPYEVIAFEKFEPLPYSYSRRLNLINVPLLPKARASLSPALASPGSAMGDDEAIDYCEGDLSDYVERLEEELPKNPSHPGRFPVMGLLQAIRYYILVGDLAEALSFGLNRAIFYAWLKYYYNPGKIKRPRGYSEEELRRIERLTPLGPLKDKAPRRGKWFEMGGQVQRPEDFFRQVARKFEYSGMPFEVAWDRAFEYVSLFPEHVLRDPNAFFKYVYEPVRDDFLLVYSRKAKPKLPPVHKYRSLFDFKK